MRILFTFLLSCLLPAFVFAELLFLSDPLESYLEFEVNHLGFMPVVGRFEGFGAVIALENKSRTISKIEVKIDSNSINTNNSLRDRRLRRSKFFDALLHPHISFRTSSALNLSDTELTGVLKLKDKEVDVTVPITFKTYQEKGSDRIIVVAETSSLVLDRRDLGITAYPFLIDNDVTVRFRLVAKTLR